MQSIPNTNPTFTKFADITQTSTYTTDGLVRTTTQVTKYTGRTSLFTSKTTSFVSRDRELTFVATAPPSTPTDIVSYTVTDNVATTSTLDHSL
jgi:hypothetical protein